MHAGCATHSIERVESEIHFNFESREQRNARWTMAFTLEANINVLWQNLIALNASLLRENEENRAELMQTKELLQKVSHNWQTNVLTEDVKQQLFRVFGERKFSMLRSL